MFNKTPWTNLHGFNLDWVIKKVQECLAAVESFGEKIAKIPETYETKNNIENSRKLSTTGDFTGTLCGEKTACQVNYEINDNRNQIQFLSNQFSDGATGLVVDGGFFDESGIKKNYDGGAF